MCLHHVKDNKKCLLAGARPAAIRNINTMNKEKILIDWFLHTTLLPVTIGSHACGPGNQIATIRASGTAWSFTIRRDHLATTAAAADQLTSTGSVPCGLLVSFSQQPPDHQGRRDPLACLQGGWAERVTTDSGCLHFAVSELQLAESSMSPPPPVAMLTMAPATPDRHPGRGGHCLSSTRWRHCC